MYVEPHLPPGKFSNGTEFLREHPRTNSYQEFFESQLRLNRVNDVSGHVLESVSRCTERSSPG